MSSFQCPVSCASVSSSEPNVLWPLQTDRHKPSNLAKQRTTPRETDMSYSEEHKMWHDVSLIYCKITRSFNSCMTELFLILFSGATYRLKSDLPVKILVQYSGRLVGVFSASVKRRRWGVLLLRLTSIRSWIRLLDEILKYHYFCKGRRHLQHRTPLPQST